MTELLVRPPETVARFTRMAGEPARRGFPGHAALPGVAGVSWGLAGRGTGPGAAASGPQARAIGTIGGQVLAGPARAVMPCLPLACALPGPGITWAGKRAGQACRADLFFSVGCGVALTVPEESVSLGRKLPGARS